jgi:hypothetical protein
MAIQRKDLHDGKIEAQKASFMKLAVEWAKAGAITPEQKDEIFYLVDKASFDYWRPLIYVIPRAPVAARLEPVPIAQCAGLGPEFILRDLHATEFDLIEP